VVPLAVAVLGCDLETAALAAATFASHPVHVEGVTSVVNRAEPLCTLFAVAARFAYERLADAMDGGACGWGAAAAAVAVVVWSAAVCGCLALAMASKETGVTVVAVLAAFDVLRAARANAALRGNGSAVRWARVSVAVRLAILGAVAGVYMLARMHLMRPGGILGGGGFLGIAWGRLSWGAVSLDESQLVRKAENPFATLTGLPK